MNPIEEQLLNAIAKRSWYAYVSEQLARCQAALELWQRRSEQSNSGFSAERIQHELAYYTRQIARWQESLDRIRSEE